MATFFSNRFPKNSHGSVGDITIYEYMGSVRILVKGKRRWFQTADLSNAGKSSSRFSDVTAMKLKGDLLLGSHRIMANNSTNQGITMNESEKTITVNSSNGFICAHHLIMAKANYSKIYLDGTSGNDYIASTGDKLDFHAGGTGIFRIQNNTSDGITIPIGNKIMFSAQDLGSTMGNASDDNYYITRAGTHSIPGIVLDTYVNDINAIRLGSSYISFPPDNFEIRLHDGSYHTGFKAHATMTANAMYTLPAAYPASNKVLQSTSAGALSWESDTNTITALNSATENELVTVGNTVTELDAEENLTFDGTILSTPRLEVGDKEGTPATFIKQIISHCGVSAPPALDFYKARGSAGSPSVLVAGEFTGTQRYLGYDGSSYELSSAIRGDVDGSVANGEVPGMLNFLTAPTAALISRMVITSSGEVGIGTWAYNSKPHNILSVDGTIGLEERASASTDASTYGQIWVKNESPNELWFTGGEGDDVQITSGTSLLDSGIIKTTVVTLDESDMNDLHNTGITLVAAQGSNKVIIPTSGMLFIDRDGSTAQAQAINFFVGYNSTTSLTATIYYIRRFMYNESGDRILHLQHYAGEASLDSVTSGDNQPLTCKIDGAITSGSIDSMKVVTTYHVFDNS